MHCFQKYHADLVGSAVPVFFGCCDSYGRSGSFFIRLDTPRIGFLGESKPGVSVDATCL